MHAWLEGGRIGMEWGRGRARKGVGEGEGRGEGAREEKEQRRWLEASHLPK